MKQNKVVLSLFFITIFLCTINEYFTFVYKENMLGNILSLVDEVFVVWLLAYTLTKRGFHVNTNVKIGIVGFCFCGLLSNILHGTSFLVAALGLFNTVKPILIFICFIQYSFSWKDFYFLMKRFCYIFPIIALGFLVDALTPSFHHFLGIGDSYYRAGFRVLSGIFVKETNSTLWALIFYLYYRFYCPKPLQSKAKYLLSMTMIFFTFKIKDILGIITCYTFTLFKKINIVYFLVGLPIVVSAFFIYMIYMPEHYNSYFTNDGESSVARVVLTTTSFLIANKNIPLGVGFGQYASPISRQYLSDVYTQFGIDNIYGLSFLHDGGRFMCDTFWPMIIGETGYLGLLFYVWLLYSIFGGFLKAFLKSTHDLRFLFVGFMFISFLVMSSGKPVFSGPPHSFVLFGFTGVFYSLKKFNFKQNDN